MSLTDYWCCNILAFLKKKQKKKPQQHSSFQYGCVQLAVAWHFSTQKTFSTQTKPSYFCLQEAWQIYTVNLARSCGGALFHFSYDRQQHSDMDVGRERSTWGEYLHSLTVRVSMIFNLPFFSCGLAHNTNAVWGMGKSAAIHVINPTLQLVR